MDTAQKYTRDFRDLAVARDITVLYAMLSLIALRHESQRVAKFIVKGAQKTLAKLTQGGKKGSI